MATKFATEAEALGPVAGPTFLNHHNGIDPELSSGAASMKRWMEGTLTGADGINARRQMADPLVTRAANMRQVEMAVEKFNATATDGYKTARANLNASIAEAETKLKNAVGIAPTGNAAEIRSAFRAMSADDRRAAMREAFANGDKEVLGAIIGFTKVMHGIDPAEVEPLLEKFKQTAAPLEYRNLAEHRRYAEWADKAEVFVMRFGTQALKGTEGYAAQRAKMASILASYGMEVED